LIEDTYRKIKKSDSLLKQTMRLFNGFIQYHGRDVAIARELIRELTFLSNEARIADMNNIANAIVGKLSCLVDNAKERGKLRAGVDTKLFARCLYSIYYQQLQTWLSGYASRRTFQKNLESMLALIIEDKSTQ
jgi:ssDNA-specific exonuclease RecJ